MRFADAIYQPRFSVVDTHCHYNMDPLYSTWREHWAKARANRVEFAWIPGTTLETSRRAVSIAAQEERMQAFIGVHPTEVLESAYDVDHTVDQLERLLVSAVDAGKPVMGIGEIGLDYFRLSVDDAAAAELERSEQRVWFRRQLELALRQDLPVSLHVRDRATPSEPTVDNAYWDTVRIFEEVTDEFGKQPPEFVLHCVSGPVEYVQAMLELGAYAGFDGNLTYPNASHIRALWRMVPATRRVLETDAPFLPPQDFRGQVCEPWMISLTAEYAEGL